MNIKSKLGFDKIINKAKSLTISELGRDFFDEIEFYTNKKFINKELSAIVEFQRIIAEKDFPVDYFFDVRDALKKVKNLENSYLLQDEILQIWRSLSTLKAILNFFSNDENSENFPVLSEKAKQVKFYSFVTDSIKQILTKDGKIKDNATKELKIIRSEISEHEKQVSGIVKRAYAEANKLGIIDEDANITIRNGKMLIPLKAMHKNKIQGIVQDYSTSGKTVYIEPIKSVELNNRIAQLKYEEKREIIKILIEFTEKIKPYIDDILLGYEFMAEIDFIRAKALLANDLNAVKPKLTDKAELNLANAFHPLLIWAYRNSNRRVVPLDIQLSDNQRIILISGPNAGGKSIAIKTVGLLQYMVQCGFLVPVRNSSVFGIFHKIFVDIGDEQSIENDLSTYSSHLLNMKLFIENSDDTTLVLIDEFGSGTDPAMGGAIAEAVIEELLRIKVKGVINTHYSNLKHFAAQNNGIENAAMLFDNDNLRPLYLMETGRPGSSFAFEIAQNIGLPDKIINRAKSKAGKNVVNFDKIITQMQQQARQIAKDRYELNKIKQQLKQKVLEYRHQNEKLATEKKKIIENAEKQAKEIIENANKIIEKTIKEIRTKNAEKQATKQIRKNFEQEKQNLKTKLETTKLSVNQEVEDIKKKLKKQEKKQKPKAEKISVGDIVIIKDKGIKAEVESIKDQMALITVGNLRSFVKLKDLEKIGKRKDTQQKVKVNISMDKQEAGSFVFGIDVRGKRANEALQKVAKYIDNAIISDVNEVKILHGTGDGILRKLIREYLQKIDEITWFGDADIRQGGAGITIVKFR